MATTLAPRHALVQERSRVPRELRHELGGYREYAPPPSLARVSEAVWVYRTPDGVFAPDVATHRVLPDPAVSIAFCCHRQSDGRAADSRLLVIGPKRTPQLCAFERGEEIAAVKLKLEWTAPLLGIVPGDHFEAEDDLSSILPRIAGPLVEILAETRSAGEALSMMTAALEREVRRGHGGARDASSRALDLVRATGGRLAVIDVARRTGASVRHLSRIVRRDAGVSLKVYARTLRLLHAVTAADRTAAAGRPAWVRLAAEAGFADQSHLVRECRALVGMSPGEVHRERSIEVRAADAHAFGQAPVAARSHGRIIQSRPRVER